MARKYKMSSNPKAGDETYPVKTAGDNGTVLPAQEANGVKPVVLNGKTEPPNGWTHVDMHGSEQDGEKNPDLNGGVVVEVDTKDVASQEGLNCCNRGIAAFEDRLHAFYSNNKRKIILAIQVMLLLCYLAYYIYCMQYKFGDEGSYVLTGITVALLIKIVAELINKMDRPSCLVRALAWFGTSPTAKRMRRVMRCLLYVIALIGIAIYLGIDVLTYSAANAQALSGIACMIVLCFIFSARPSRVNWHPVFWGFIIQFLFAIITLRTEPGYRAFKWLGDLVNEFVRLSDKGSNFVLGASFRATGPGFFFETAGVIVFFNACIFVLDYVGVLEFIILKIGRGLALCLETGPIESVVAAANIFIGLSEAPLLVRPYLPVITNSELHAIMTCGFASISGAFMAMFIKAGAPPTHMLTACLISAPAALAISKLIYPEVEKVDFNSQKNIRMRDSTSARTGVQAISDGATFSIKLIAQIMVNMMAFVSILNLVDTLLIWAGERAGKNDLSFNYISSYVFYPLSWVMGIPSQDCRQAAYIMGLKLLATPFVAYKDLGALIQNRHDFEDYIATSNGTWYYEGSDIVLNATQTVLTDGVLEARTEAILTYAMCGLSAFPAIGFTMGTLIPMSPSRKEDVVSMVVSAFIAGNMANFATGAVAGVMFDGK